MSACPEATCNLFCAGSSGTFGSSGRSTRKTLIQTRSMLRKRERIACANTYRHEITVLATVFAGFLAISAVRTPVCTDELQSCHFVVLCPEGQGLSRDLNDFMHPCKLPCPRHCCPIPEPTSAVSKMTLSALTTIFLALHYINVDP
jgi:hypothetical protein